MCAHADRGEGTDEGVGVPLVLMLHTRRHFDLADLPDELAGQLGRLTVRIARAVEDIPHIARCHVYRIGDGGAHMHGGGDTSCVVRRPTRHGGPDMIAPTCIQWHSEGRRFV